MAGPRLLRLWFALLALGAAALAAPPFAGAAFPGRNGRIAYVHERMIDDASPHVSGWVQSKIASVLPNGGRRRTLRGRFSGESMSTFLSDPAYSPNGRKLALAFGPSTWSHPLDPLEPPRQEQLSSSLYLGRADGHGRLRRLTGQRPRQFDRGPAWAPGGRRLAYIRFPEIRIYRARRSRSIGGEADHLAWSVRGQIVISRSPGGSAYDPESIYLMRRDGSHPRFVVDGDDPDWSADGRWIVYTTPAWPGGIGAPPQPPGFRQGIALIRPDGSHRRVLTNDGSQPAFSPDGKYIVFIRRDNVRQADTLVILRLRDRRTRTIVRARPPGPYPPRPDAAYETDGLRSPTWQPLPRRRHR